MSIFRWTLLMALSAFPEHSTIQITKKQLDDYYEWLYGPSIAQRQNNPPTVYKLRWAERQAWSAITDILWEERHKGTTLAQAITTIQGRTLWWNDLLAEKPKTDNNPKGTPKGTPKGAKDKGKGKSDKGKGKADKGGKTQKNHLKNNGKGNQNTNTSYLQRLNNQNAPNNARTVTDRPPPCRNPIKCTMQQWYNGDAPNGRPFCRNFHFKTCPGGCGRTHNCPYDNNGTPCNARPGQCSHRWQ